MKMLTSRRMGWTGRAVRMGEMRYVHSFGQKPRKEETNRKT